jgi:hypothetical protein
MINSGILDFPRLVRVGALQLEKSLEAAIDHALAVERMFDISALSRGSAITLALISSRCARDW